MAKKRIQGITIALDADTKGVTSGLKDVVSQSNKVSGELRQVESLLKFNPDNVTLLAQKQELLTKQVDLTTKRLEAMKGAQEDVQNQFKNGDIGEEEFRTFQREIAATEGRLDNYKKKLAEIENSSDGAGNATNDLSDDMGDLGGSMETVGQAIKGGVLMEAADQLSAIGDKIVEIGNVAKDFAMESEASYGKFYATTNLSGQALENLKAVAQDVFKTGVTDSIDEATDATSLMKQAFKDLNDTDLAKLTSQVMLLSDRTGTDVAENVTGTTQLMKAFGIDAQKSLDLVAAGYKNGLNASGDFMDTLNEYAPLFQQAGFSAEDMLSIMKNGLDNGAMNTDKVADAVKELQIRLGDGSFESSLETFSSNTKSVFEDWKQGKATVADVAQSVQNDLNKMSPSEQQAALSALSSQFEDLGVKAGTSLFNIGNEFDNVNGKLDEAAQKTDAEKWQEALNEIQAALLPIGTDILNALLPILDLLSNLATWFGNLPGPVRTFIEVFGGALAILTLLMPIIASIIVVVGVLGTSVGLVVGIVVGAIAVIAAIITAIKNWGSITDWLGDKWDKFSSWFGGLMDGIGKKAGEVVNKISKFFKGLKLKLPEIKFPKIKLPHFSIKGDFDILKGKIPKLSVDWFAKGGILTKPTIFGTNGNSLMAGGEAGKEAVAPLSDLMAYVEKAVANQIGNKGDEIHLHLTTYGAMPKETMDQIANYMMYKLADLQREKKLG
ncbi:phage tail tape measure protein [Listeria monocytogenes]|nr:phage tail tape measure protein [Listeria monocytogenes]EAC2325712.1 phage tail tape measure protein [Listeria monocytogenes]EAC2672998.1 phage tail tape measure protein [Listeria monocytogenes]EAC3851552.1 phage tail tape measure protein [Listeria monocytogenes]EAC3854987.1 phage tail tape measure protein [Listeria monocytogenes]